jgi:hypothetical protein
MRASARPEAVAVLAEGGIKNRLQYLQQCLLDQTIRDRWHGCFELHIGPVSLWDQPRSLIPFIPLEVFSLLC